MVRKTPDCLIAQVVLNRMSQISLLKLLGQNYQLLDNVFDCQEGKNFP